ncbi:hypothetical protein Cgig2_012398 [Carnegiea gigantea]|uniref:Uncharacterized protein n=1 Tax=Carnegiea gigantea TaxID=171969 RepID=A0A9Q1JTD6_9CARY|nr:hypothetical protein Cgig2_012398 [Carnegiea gigantea]
MKYSLSCTSTCCLTFVFSLSLFHLCSIANAERKEGSKANIPAVFAFGDSIVDPGNNNDILTLIKANFPPYGKDFEDGKPTGRFSNGRIPTDFLAEALGIKRNIPAYLDPDIKENDLLTGVSFASGASGFDPLTPRLLMAKTLKDEFKMFKEYISKANGIVGGDRTSFIVNNSIFFLVCGSDDIANTYFSIPFIRDDYDVDAYTSHMCDSASSFIKKLHKVGVRRIFTANVPPVGCVPAQRTLGGGLFRDCAKDRNHAAELFNGKLEAELKFLGDKLSNSEIVYMDLYSIFLDLIHNATNYVTSGNMTLQCLIQSSKSLVLLCNSGFEVIDRGCCGSGLIEAGPLCNSFSMLCGDDNKNIFWDSYHSSERAYKVIIRRIVDRYLKHIT